MKRLLLLVALVLAIAAGGTDGGASPRTNPALFTVTVHVSKSYLVMVPDQPFNQLAQYLDVTIDGHRLVLDGALVKSKKQSKEAPLLPVGDYKAQVKKEETNPNGTYSREYKILLKDGSTWDCAVVGESE